MASTYLTRTPSSTTNRRTFTLSYWVKFSDVNMSSAQRWFSAGNDGTGNLLKQEFFGGTSTRTIALIDNNNNGTGVRLTTKREFRDGSSWYHIVYAVDTTQATASNRVKMYVNGEQNTDWYDSSTHAEYPDQNYDFNVNVSGQAMQFGRSFGFSSSSPDYFDGSMAHVHFIDGTAYAASTFGETDSTTGQWKPKTTPSVTYGTNGFFLKFANSGSMGTDSSGNGNNFTVNGTLTQTQDTPSNVFCCLNPLKKHSGQTLSYLNLRNVGAGSANIVGSTFAPSQGKWYFEFKLVSANAYAVFLYPQNLYQVGDDLFGSNYTTAIYATDPSLYRNGSNAGNLGGGVANNDIIQVAMDLDSNNIYFGKNGNWNDGLGGGFDQSDFSNATGHTLTRNSSFDEIGIATLNGGSGSSYTLDWNFGNGYFGTTAVSSSNADGAGLGLFEYAPPTGYYSLCTKNINTYG